MGFDEEMVLRLSVNKWIVLEHSWVTTEVNTGL
jgi:hypothetical protein